MLVNININGKDIQVEKGTTVLQAAQDNGIYIPTLCFLKEINEIAACRMCVAEFDRMGIKPTCTLEANEGMIVQTDSEKVINSRKNTLELLASYHSFECWTCAREDSCHFYDMMNLYNADDVYVHDYDLPKKERVINESSAITLDSAKCVHCSSCIAVCEKIQTIGTLDFMDRGFDTIIAPTNVGETLDNGSCIACGLCTKVCPTAAITETSHIDQVEEAIRDPHLHVIAQIDPAVRAAIGEEFGYEIGTPIEEYDAKFMNALKQLGFDEITHTNLAEDLAIMESSYEFLDRFQDHLNGDEAHLPLLSSCSPSWIKYLEQFRPEYLANSSTLKSPHMMQGAFIKSVYGKEVYGKDGSEIYMVSISPCTAHKSEMSRDDMEVDGARDVDAVLTTREIARMIKDKRISLKTMDTEVPHDTIEEYTGSSTIFGISGGVMEATLKTVYSTMQSSELPDIDFTQLRDVEQDIKEATINIAGLDVNVAVVHGGQGIKKMFEILDEENMKKEADLPYKQYHFIELSGVPGGDVNGGGQPIVREEFMSGLDVTKLRANSLLNSSEHTSKVREAHNNPEVKRVYDEYLNNPGSVEAKKYLHTAYTDKKNK